MAAAIENKRKMPTATAISGTTTLLTAGFAKLITLDLVAVRSLETSASVIVGHKVHHIKVYLRHFRFSFTWLFIEVLLTVCF